jgi:hypothetical protein
MGIASWGWKTALAPAACVAFFLGAGCSDERTALTGGAPPGCKGGEGCAPAGGVVITTGASGGQDGGAGTVDITGTVVQVMGSAFSVGQPYQGAASVVAVTPGGGSIEATYDGKSFSLAGVPTGDEITFRVVDTTPAPDILSTLSTQRVTASTSAIVLPAVFDETLRGIASCMQVGFDPSRAHAVLRITRGDVSLSGVSLSQDNQDLGTAAFDSADPASLCPFALDAPVTGPNGLLLLFDLPVPVGGRLPIKLDDPNGVTYSGAVDVATGTVTFTALEL